MPKLLNKPDPNWTIKIRELQVGQHVFLATPYSSRFETWQVAEIDPNFFSTEVQLNVTYERGILPTEVFKDRYTDLNKTLLLADTFKHIIIQYQKTKEVYNEPTSNLQP